jgi:3-oxoacyl-(acyl-carrier-protein) synthase
MMSGTDRFERRRVVVTGLGVVSPNGLGADAYQISLRQGVSGISTIASFDPSSLSCRVAAEVRDICADHIMQIMQGFCIMQAVSTSHNDEPARASRCAMVT